MRIIAGTFGGRILKTANAGKDFRPTTDRIRESLFNIIDHSEGFAGKTVADLFAGTGAFGIEAISRGAKHAVFVEWSQTRMRILRKNVAELGIANQAELIKDSVERFVKTTSRKFDIIFCDPPYAYGGFDSLLETVAEECLLANGGILYVEHSRNVSLSLSAQWQLVKMKKYGTTCISILEQVK